MKSEFDEALEPRDRTWMVWVGLGVVLCIMVVALGLQHRGKADRSVVRARHILISYEKTDPLAKERALKQITDLRARIVAGESFSQIALDYSQDPSSARRGGDLNYAERGIYAEAFENYVWNAPIGELSEVIETSFGFHLIIVEDRVISDVDRVVMEQERAIRKELQEQQQNDADAVPEP